MERKRIYSACVTPLKADGALDRQGLKNIIDRNVRHGLDGLFILGTMGEWGSFDDDFQEEVVECAVSAAAGRLETLVGVCASSLPVSLRKMARYAKYPCTSFVFMPPAGRTSALDNVTSILQFLDAADRPSCFYYAPANNGVTLSPAQLERILAHPNLKALKDSSSNMFVRRELIYRKRAHGYKAMLLNGQEWSGDEAMWLGYDGILCGMGALCSNIMVKMGRAIDAGDIAEAQRLQWLFIDICHGVYGPNMETTRPGQKYALMRLGLIESPLTLAHDMACLTDDAKKRIDACLDRFRAELD